MQHRSIAAIIVLSMATTAAADYDCIEGLPNATRIKLERHLPPEWFLVGGMSLRDPAFESSLVRRYGLAHDKTPNKPVDLGVYVCTFGRSGYIGVGVGGEFGPTVEYAAKRPMCMTECKTRADSDDLASGTGLRLGQTKKEVGRVLGVSIQSDVTEVEFEEVEGSNGLKVLHIESVRIQFHKSRLVRFMISDYREEA